MSKLLTLSLASAAILIMTATLFGCPGKLAPSVRPTDSVSNSEIAEAVASGVITATWSNGTEARYIPRSPKARALAEVLRSYFTLVPKAEAAISQGLCTSLQTGTVSPVGIFAPNAGCTNTVNGFGQQVETLTWTPCNGAAPLGTWSGGVNFTLIFTPSTTLNCVTGTFPTFQNTDVLWRTFFSPSGRINNYTSDPKYPGSYIAYNPVTGQDINPVTVLVDTFGATQLPVGFDPTTINANNYKGTLPSNYPLTGYSGYTQAQSIPTVGETIVFSGAIARQINVIGIHVKGAIGGYIVWDFTISSAFPGQPTQLINLDNTNTIIAPAAILYVQDNLNSVTTASTIAVGTAYANGCGVPTGGSVATAKVAGPGNFNPETLTFSGTCANATLGATPIYLFHSF